ncbi:MAG: DUF4434 domain-containing protein [Clostridiales bacterium]|nr:DUF4434 domain-containing protein [Candidatus Coliplasma caballi]
MQKPITGTWFEFWHHNIPEGKYWNPIVRGFSAEQWEAKVDEIASVGMKYIVLMDTGIQYPDHAEAYYPTDIYPFADMACKAPIEALLSAADRNGIKVFMSCGFYGLWTDTLGNMTSPEVTARAFKAMDELWALYGKHPSFYGWYFPDETCIAGHFLPAFIDYVNKYSAHAHEIAPNTKTLIAPYGTNILVADDEYVEQLKALDVDVIAYQDEIGVRKSKPEDTKAYYKALRAAHDKAGKAKLWADMEVFEFEGDVYRSALCPATMERVERQIESIAEYVDEILCYQYQGMFNKPGTIAFCGHPDSIRYYNELAEHNAKYAK